MNQTFFTLLILFSFQCYGQKIHLNNFDQNKKYPYEYWFQYENLEDTSSFKMSIKQESQISIFKILDNKGDAVIYANVKLINLETETETKLISEFNETTEFYLENGKYRIEVRALNYDEFNLEIEVANGKQIELNINLGLAPELTVYKIDSKEELKETELYDIIECVKINRNGFFKSCSKWKKYRVLMLL